MASNAKIEELRKQLRDAEIQRNKTKYGMVIRKVVACMTLGIDVSSLFSEMILAAATDDLIQKKLVYMYICNYVDRFPDLIVLIVNTLHKDSRDSSTIVRSLALRNLCSLRLPNLIEYVREPLLAGLADSNYYVRKTAVIGCIRIHHFAPAVLDELGIVDKLYAMLKDTHPVVISNCVLALDEIMVEEGGMAINRNIANHLLNKLREFNEWGQCYILDILHRYKPSNDNEICDILNLIDDRLKQGNSGVVFSAAKLFLKLTDYFQNIRHHVFGRLKDPLLTILSSSRPEVAHVCLKHIQILLEEAPRLFDNDYKNFYFRYNDPNYIKLQKLNILTKISTAENAEDIVNELSSYITDVDITIAGKAIESVGRLALKLAECCEYCVHKLLSYFSLEIDFVTTYTLLSLKDILRKYPRLATMVATEINEIDDGLQDPDGKCALIWILGEYGENIDRSPYLLEEYIDCIKEEGSASVKLYLLTATMKLFFKRPPECVAMLGKLFEYIINEESDVDVRDRALFYYRLLSHDVQKAKQIVLNPVKEITQFSEETAVDFKTVQSATFNTLAVLYEKPILDLDLTTADEIKDLSSSESDNQQQVSTESPDHISLNLAATLSPTQFEQQWFSIIHSITITHKLKTFIAPQDLEQYLTSLGIFTIAASKPDQNPIKYYFFAQTELHQELVLMDCNFDVKTMALTLNLKCLNPAVVEDLKTFIDKKLRHMNWL